MIGYSSCWRVRRWTTTERVRVRPRAAVRTQKRLKKMHWTITTDANGCVICGDIDTFPYIADYPPMSSKWIKIRSVHDILTVQLTKHEQIRVRPADYYEIGVVLHDSLISVWQFLKKKRRNSVVDCLPWWPDNLSGRDNCSFPKKLKIPLKLEMSDPLNLSREFSENRRSEVVGNAQS